MADQETLISGQASAFEAIPGGLVGNVAEFGNDVATLVELQAKLAAADFKESLAKTAIPLVLVIVGAILLLAALPVLLIGVGSLLAPVLGWSFGLAVLVTAVVALAIAAVLVLVSVGRLAHGFDSFRRSREELTRNIAFIRTVVVHSGRSRRGK